MLAERDLDQLTGTVGFVDVDHGDTGLGGSDRAHVCLLQLS